MRIAIITSGYFPGLDGTTVVVHERCRRLSEWGHEVLIVGPDYAPIAHYFPNWARHQGEVFPNVKSVSVPCRTFFGVEWERNPTPRAFKVLEEHLDRFTPDVIHVDEPERLTYGYWRRPGLAYARRRGIPVVAFFHTNYVEYGPDFLPLGGAPMRWLQRAAEHGIAAVYNAYDATLVPGETTAAKLRRIGVRNLVVDRFNGVDYERFRAARADSSYLEQRFGLSGLQDRIRILMVGRLTPDKGWAFAMQALPALVREVGRDRLAVLVAGGGEMHDEIRDRLTAQGVRVHMLGRVPPDEIAALYASTDLYLSCSRKENWGLTVAEALSAGTPAIVPRAGGFIDQIVDGVNGHLFIPDDVADFVRVVRRFVEDASLRDACGQAGQRLAAAYDWDLVIGNWLKAVSSVRPAPVT